MATQLAEWQPTCLLIAINDEVEEELASDAVEGDEADVVEDEQVGACEAVLQTGELALVAGLEQRAHQMGRAPEGDVALLSRGLDAKAVASCVLPLPIGPAKMRFSPSVIQRPRASSAICAAIHPLGSVGPLALMLFSYGSQPSR